ncbi:MAG: hypothetical protein KKD56_11720 [Acidobacteria bacterium]|nr:hypothetical protein [Acidobacteriota bacterium]MBU1475677.1 hypothetical protein [Acidobacteriota bacterium]
MRKQTILKILFISVVATLLIHAVPLYSQQTEPPQVKRTAILLTPEKEDGKLEITFHYGTWSLNPIKATFEEDLTRALANEIRREVSNQAGAYTQDLVRGDFTHTLAFTTTGSHYGLEIRYYPKGRKGPFSLGFSVEKTIMTMTVAGLVNQTFTDGTYGEVDAAGTLEFKPLSTNLSFRWDMAPKWSVSPYFVFGLGIAPLNGTISYDFTGTYYWSGQSASLSDTGAKTFKEAEEGSDFNLPNIFIVGHVAFGVRANIASHFVLLVEGGFWDGIVFRGGLGIRF